MSTGSAIHPSIVQRACDVLVFHPECPPMPEGTEGLAYAMEAALEAALVDLLPEARMAGARAGLGRLCEELDESRSYKGAELIVWVTGLLNNPDALAELEPAAEVAR